MYFFLLVLFTVNVIFLQETSQNNSYLISIVDIDGLVPYHQGISSHSAENVPMHFQLFMG